MRMTKNYDLFTNKKDIEVDIESERKLVNDLLATIRQKIDECRHQIR